MEFVKSENLPIHIKSWCRDIEDTAMAQAENLARHLQCLIQILLFNFHVFTFQLNLALY